MAFKSMKITNAPATAINQYRIDCFKGADLTTEAANVNPARSPSCPNMIRESVGKVRKWIGYKTIKSYPFRINAVHKCLFDKNYTLVHSGKNIYLQDGITDTLLYENANDERSISFQVGTKLFILDGLTILAFGIFENVPAIKLVSDIAYVPTILISRNPGGGGTPHEAVNLLSAKRKESFLADGTTKIYQLSANALDITEVLVERNNASGGVDTLKENTDFTVERPTGKIIFTNVPAKPLVTGQDNIFITYSKTVSDYAERINKCNIGILYGVGGGRDRLFVSGNPKFKNRDYYSQLNDPTYFGDLWYSVLGQDNSKIMGYSIISDKLAAHLDKSADKTNIILRQGVLENNEARFILSGALQGVGTISSHSFGVLEGEPLFLSDEGVFAITASDVQGERISQLRSYFLNGLLLKQNLNNCFAVTFDGFYMLACDGYLFALDSSQYAMEENKPFSHRQYEGYYRTNINARILFVEDNFLWFGTVDGKLCRFHNDYSIIGNFNDDGIPIHGEWLTPKIIGKNFFSNKNFKRISVYLGSAVATGCRMWGLYEGIRELLIDYSAKARYFSFKFLTFSKLTFKTDRSPQVIGGKKDGKIRISKQQGVRFLFENDILNEPFSLYSATIEFTESR